MKVIQRFSPSWISTDGYVEANRYILATCERARNRALLHRYAQHNILSISRRCLRSKNALGEDHARLSVCNPV
jgi:hypothetical protein